MQSKNLLKTLLVAAVCLVGSIKATPAVALEGRQTYCPQDVDLPIDAGCPFARPPRCDIAEFSFCPACCQCPPHLELEEGGSCPFVQPKDCERKVWSHCPACCEEAKV